MHYCPPSSRRWLMRAPGRAATSPLGLDAQTPGVRTTRLLRPRTDPPDRQGLACAHPRQSTSPLSSAGVVPRRVRTHGCPPCHHAARADAAASTATRPACRDDRERPFGRARMSVVCHKSEIRKSEIFLRGGLDRVFCPTPRGCRPRAARGLGQPAATPSLRAQRSNPDCLCGKRFWIASLRSQ
ncbi:hypothetical protein ACVWWR_002065 [Bradyrhizobium sp. LM3.2]